jgi:hypothetical protein
MRLEPARRPVSPQPSDWIPEPGFGQRVEVQWDDPPGWYAGTVVSEARGSSHQELVHRQILYDDGAVTMEQLGGRRTRPISTAHPNQQPSTGVARGANSSAAAAAASAAPAPARAAKAAATNAARVEMVAANEAGADSAVRGGGGGGGGAAAAAAPAASQSEDKPKAGHTQDPAAAAAAAAPAPAPGAPAPATSAAAAAASSPQAIYLPLGVTDAQRAKIEENLHGERSGPAGGVMGRFGLAGLPENTWDCAGSQFTVGLLSKHPVWLVSVVRSITHAH